MSINKIDSHQHYWNPARGDYCWMPKNDLVLARTYSPSDLEPQLADSGISHTVLVQAAPSTAETEYLLGIADAKPHVATVVGWVDFEDPNQIQQLERFAEHPKFAGVRPMIQDIKDPDWMLRDDIQWAYEALIELDLTFDCLGFPIHLSNFHTLLCRYPKLKSVIDHCMKPSLRDHASQNFDFWAEGMSILASDTAAFCKLSGLVTEADSLPKIDMLRPYVDHVIEKFGADRVMWGSDWPVCRQRCEYSEWHKIAVELCANLSPEKNDQVFCQSAKRFYGITEVFTP